MPKRRKERNLARLRERLLRAGKQGERSAPLVFAGREAVIASILRTANVLPPDGAVGNTFVVEGPPGAGKTALVGEVARRLRSTGRSAIVHNRVPDAAGVRTVYEDMRAALDNGSADDTRVTREGKLTIGGGVGPVSIQRTTGTTLTPPEQLEVAHIARMRGGRPFPDDAGGVVFVDEVQNVRPGSPAAGMLEDLHTQSSIPFLLVCAGLSTSVERLAEAGISRLNEPGVVMLGCLAPEETLDCARRTLAKSREWGVSASEAAVARWAKAIASASNDWPRHLQCYLNAVWTVLAEQETPNLDTADLDGVLVQGDELRQSYYNSRLEMSHVPVEVASVLHGALRDSRAPMGRLAAAALVENAIGAILDETEKKIVRSKFKSPGDCFNALLRAGVVSMDRGRGCVVSPIPSMTQHILDARAGRGVK